MSEQPEHEIEQDQGGQLLPFPGAQVPEVPAEAALEPAPEPLEGEIVTDEEYSCRKGLQRDTPRLVVMQRVVVVVTSPRTASTARATVRAGVTIGQGVGSCARRGWDAATLGVYRQEIQAARAAGDHDRVAEWTTRHREVKQQRHQRLMDAPKVAVGLGIVAGGGLVALVVVIVLVGLLVQVSGAGEFLGVIEGVLGAVRWVIDAVPVAGTVVLGRRAAVAGAGGVAGRPTPGQPADMAGHGGRGRRGRHH